MDTLFIPDSLVHPAAGPTPRVRAGMLRTEDLRKLAALIRGYFDEGGHHVQFNIVDRAVLLDAMEHPEHHRNLIVRVAGYSDYFVLLSPEIQREILSRTEHVLGGSPSRAES